MTSRSKRLKNLYEPTTRNSQLSPTENKVKWEPSNIFTLTVHNTDFSKNEVVINPEVFKGLKCGDNLEIELTEILLQNKFQNKFVLQIGENDINKDSGLKHIQISLIKTIADQYGIDKKAKCKVSILADLSKYKVKTIGISVKDMFFSRRDMGLIQTYLRAQKLMVYENKQIIYEDQPFKVNRIKLKSTNGFTGLIDQTTKFKFYTRSCRAYWILELSKELYEFDNNGHLIYERIFDFISKCFEEFRENGITHRITFIICGRLFYPCFDITKGCAFLNFDQNWRIYNDYFQNVVTVQPSNKNAVQTLLWIKKTIAELPDKINWSRNRRIDCVKTDTKIHTNYTGNQLPQCELSNSKDFCLLEALSICYKEIKINGQQSLDLTGNQILVLSPGNGIYNVNPDFSGTMKHLFSNFDCNIDLFCFNYPPLHIVPLFEYELKTTNEKQYKFAYWINLCFIQNYKNQSIFGINPEKMEKLVKQANENPRSELQKITNAPKTQTKTVFEYHDDTCFTSENFDVEQIDILARAIIIQNPKLLQPAKNKTYSSQNAILLEDNLKKQRLTRMSIVDTSGLSKKIESPIKKNFNPFVKFTENTKHYKGFLYHSKSKGSACAKENFNRLFDYENFKKCKPLDSIKYLCNMKLMRIEISKDVHTNTSGNSLKIIPAYIDSKRTTLNHIEELALQMLNDGFQLLAEKDSENFKADNGFNSIFPI